MLTGGSFHAKNAKFRERASKVTVCEFVMGLETLLSQLGFLFLPSSRSKGPSLKKRFSSLPKQSSLFLGTPLWDLYYYKIFFERERFSNYTTISFAMDTLAFGFDSNWERIQNIPFSVKQEC